MNTSRRQIAPSSLVAAAVTTALLAACASGPTTPTGAEEVRSRLLALQSDPNLGSRAAVAMEDADAAVRAAQVPESDKVLAAHRVYIADRKVESARALAETSAAEAERTALTQQREQARLDARTREADVARNQARIAQSEGEAQRLAAEQARSDADAARMAASESQRQTDLLKQQIADLEGEVTDRGIVLTMGDTLFTSGKADLLAGTTGNLDKLAAFLAQYPDRTVSIEGHTDSVGSENSNHVLSERRAQAVKSYLVGQGVGATRLSAMGRGETTPVADNESATGRQVNRRVEVIISNVAPMPR